MKCSGHLRQHTLVSLTVAVVAAFRRREGVTAGLCHVTLMGGPHWHSHGSGPLPLTSSPASGSGPEHVPCVLGSGGQWPWDPQAVSKELACPAPQVQELGGHGTDVPKFCRTCEEVGPVFPPDLQ